MIQRLIYISNIIISTCDNEDCLKVSFNKVAEKGIKLSKESTANINSNHLSNFYHSIQIVTASIILSMITKLTLHTPAFTMKEV